MKIKVFSELEIQRFITDKKHIVISIQEPNYDYVPLPNQSSRIDVLGLKFYDIDQPIGQAIYDDFLFENYHAQKIFDFVNKYINDIELIAINCVAGISRSAGVAGALSKILNGDDFYFFSNNYCPNMRVYKKILEKYCGESWQSY